MSELTFNEFLKLSEEEKSIRYKDLSSHNKFLARISQTPVGINEKNNSDLVTSSLIGFAIGDAYWYVE